MLYQVNFLLSKDNKNWTRHSQIHYIQSSEHLFLKKLLKQLKKKVEKKINDDSVFIEYLDFKKL